jgi:hypothetical protein
MLSNAPQGCTIPAMDEREPRSPYAFKITPLPIERAAIVYALTLVISSYAWMNAGGEARAQAHRLWPLAVIVGLTVLLIMMRLLSRLLTDNRFLLAVAAVLAAATAGSLALMPPSGALGVLRSFNYGALIVSAGLAGLARLLDRPWRRENARWMAANLAVAAGAAAALLLLHY